MFQLRLGSLRCSEFIDSGWSGRGNDRTASRFMAAAESTEEVSRPCFARWNFGFRARWLCPRIILTRPRGTPGAPARLRVGLPACCPQPPTGVDIFYVDSACLQADPLRLPPPLAYSLCKSDHLCLPFPLLIYKNTQQRSETVGMLCCISYRAVGLHGPRLVFGRALWAQ